MMNTSLTRTFAALMTAILFTLPCKAKDPIDDLAIFVFPQAKENSQDFEHLKKIIQLTLQGDFQNFTLGLQLAVSLGIGRPSTNGVKYIDPFRGENLKKILESTDPAMIAVRKLLVLHIATTPDTLVNPFAEVIRRAQNIKRKTKKKSLPYSQSKKMSLRALKKSVYIRQRHQRQSDLISKLVHVIAHARTPEYFETDVIYEKSLTKTAIRSLLSKAESDKLLKISEGIPHIDRTAFVASFTPTILSILNEGVQSVSRKELIRLYDHVLLGSLRTLDGTPHPAGFELLKVYKKVFLDSGSPPSLAL